MALLKSCEWDQEAKTVRVVAVDLTAYKRDGSVAPDETTGPDLWLANNSCGDDAADGTLDDDDNDVNMGGVAKENDMAKVHFAFDGFTGLTTGEVVITRSGYLRLWRYDYKGTEIDFNSVGSYYEKVYDLNVPAQKTAFETEIKDSNLWLEGAYDGYTGGIGLSYKTAADETVCSDYVGVRVISAGMAIYKCDNSTEVGEDKKADPGAFIPYNNDDDDEDGVLDRLDPDEDTPGEDDLIKVDFLFTVPLCQGVYTEGYAVIRRKNTNIKLWWENDKDANEFVFDSAGGLEKVYDMCDSEESDEFEKSCYEENYLWISRSLPPLITYI